MIPVFMIVFVKYTISWLTNGSFCVVNILSRSQSGILLIIAVNTVRRFLIIRASKVLPVRSWYAFLFFMALVANCFVVRYLPLRVGSSVSLSVYSPMALSGCLHLLKLGKKWLLIIG